MERVLILGSEGFIGKKLQEKLEKENCRVWGYDRTGESSNSNLLIGEFKTEDRLYDYIRDNGIDTVFHLISTTYPKEDTSDIPEEIENNVIPTVRLLESIKSMDGIRLVFVSSGGTVYGESNGGSHNPDELLHPICGYGAQKAVIESPWLALTNPPAIPLQKLAQVLGKFNSKIRVRTGLKVDAISHRSDLVDLVTKDGIYHELLSLRLFSQIMEAGRFAQSQAEQLKIPTLLFCGEEDQICSPLAIRSFAENAGANLELVEVAEGYHALHLDTKADAFIDKMKAFLLE